MRITKRQLRKIIKEERVRLLHELKDPSWKKDYAGGSGARGLRRAKTGSSSGGIGAGSGAGSPRSGAAAAAASDAAARSGPITMARYGGEEFLQVRRELGEELEDSINSWIASRIKVEFLPEIGGQHVIRGIDPGMFNDVVEEIQDSGGRVVRQAPSKLTGWDIYVML
jgi:hypothetical protein